MERTVTLYQWNFKYASKKSAMVTVNYRTSESDIMLTDLIKVYFIGDKGALAVTNVVREHLNKLKQRIN